MTGEQPQKSFAENQTEQLRRELPGTIACITIYAFFSLIGCLMFVPMPYGLIAAICLVSLYIGSIVMFGQGSIIEMGLLAVILLVLACLCGEVSRVQKRPSDNTSTTIKSGG